MPIQKDDDDDCNVRMNALFGIYMIVMYMLCMIAVRHPFVPAHRYHRILPSAFAVTNADAVRTLCAAAVVTAREAMDAFFCWSDESAIHANDHTSLGSRNEQIGLEVCSNVSQMRICPSIELQKVRLANNIERVDCFGHSPCC